MARMLLVRVRGRLVCIGDKLENFNCETIGLVLLVFDKCVMLVVLFRQNKIMSRMLEIETSISVENSYIERAADSVRNVH